MMELPKILIADEGCDVLKTEDGSFYAVMCSENPATIPVHVAEIACRWNACAGIDTAHLWPGAMREMMEALAPFADEASGWVDDWPDEQPLFAPGQGHAKVTLGDCRRARAILAKLGKVGE